MCQQRIINWNFCHVVSYTTRFFSSLSWLWRGNQSLFPSQSREDLRKCRWVTLLQYLVTHRAINTHRTALQPFTGISHGKPGRIKAPPNSEMFKDFVRDGQCEVSHFYKDSWYSAQCNFLYLMVLLYCLMILLSDKWELAGMLHSKTNYQHLPVKPGLPAGICVCWLWFYSTLSLMI